MADDQRLPADLELKLRHSELRPVYEVAAVRRRIPNKPGQFEDMGVVKGAGNLAQAVILRLLTPRGELAALGHPEYGSRLHELIGRENTATTRNMLRLFILESLKMEPRLEKTEAVLVEAAQGSRDRVKVLLRVKPVGLPQTVTIGPFTLELEQ